MSPRVFWASASPCSAACRVASSSWARAGVTASRTTAAAQVTIQRIFNGRILVCYQMSPSPPSVPASGAAGGSSASVPARQTIPGSHGPRSRTRRSKRQNRIRHVGPHHVRHRGISLPHRHAVTSEPSHAPEGSTCARASTSLRDRVCANVPPNGGHPPGSGVRVGSQGLIGGSWRRARSTIRRAALDDPASASSPLPFLSMSRRDPGAVRQRRPVRSHPLPVTSLPRRWPARICPPGLVVGVRLGLGDAGMATRSWHGASGNRPRGAGLTAPRPFPFRSPVGAVERRERVSRRHRASGRRARRRAVGLAGPRAVADGAIPGERIIHVGNYREGF